MNLVPPHRQKLHHQHKAANFVVSIGSSFEAHLRKEGAYEETTAVATKRVPAWQLRQAMEAEGMSKNQMAKRMNTNRSQRDRILDPDEPKILLDTIKAAHVLGREVRLDLV